MTTLADIEFQLLTLNPPKTIKEALEICEEARRKFYKLTLKELLC